MNWSWSVGVCLVSLTIGLGLSSGCARSKLNSPTEGRSTIDVAPPIPATLSHRLLTWRRIPSTIVSLDATGDPMIPQPTVEHPAQVRVGEPLRVTVRSFGGGCEAAGGADGWVEDLEAEIRPWDYTHVPEGPAGMDYICTVPLNIFKRAVPLVFDQAGTATIRVHGIRSHAREPERPITLISSVQVR